MRRSNSPFDDKYATGNSTGITVVDQPAGQPHNQLGGIIHASGESSGVVGKERVRFDRSAPTGPTRTSSATSTMNSTSNPLLRRAPASSDAIPHSTSTSTIRLVAPVEKRPSKHADLIDKWDGSGFGKSMLHHSGPYDAAAPSRNDAKERGAERAPMGVFDPKKGSKVTELDVRAWNLKAASAAEPGMGSALPSAQPSSGGLSQTQSRPQHGRFRSGSITRVMDSKASPGLEQEVVFPSLPNSGALPMTARPSRPGRKSSINSPGIYGSLQEEYSNNLPSSGGYFDNSGSPNRAVGSPGRRISMGPGADLEEEEKKMRQREREQKRRALQAAWGIDEPEPYEDFGGFAQNDVDSISLNDNAEPIAPVNEGPRSPGKSGGLSLGGLMRTTSRNANGNSRYTPSPAGEKSEYFAGTGRPPMDGDRVLGSGTSFDSNGNGKGVKRTRSLMQRFRAMRDNPNVPVNSDAAMPLPRAGSPASAGKAGRHSPWNEDTLGIMGDSSTPTNGQQPSEAVTNPPTLQLGREKDEGGVQRQRSFLGRRKPSRSNVAAVPASPVEPQEEILITHEPEPRKASPSYGGMGGRDKALPPPPAPVMPVFEDQFADMRLKPPTEGAGVQRKTSLMKKLKARIG